MRCFLCTAIVVCFLIQSTHALTLEEAVAEAKKKNWDIAVIDAKLKQAELVVNKAMSAYLPQIDATGAYTRNSSDIIIAFPFPNGESKDIVLQQQDSLAAQIQIGQMLISPWLISNIFNAAKYKRLSKHNAAFARKEVLFAVTQAYYGAVAQKDLVTIQNKMLEMRKAHENDVKLKADYVAKIEIVKAEIERSKNEQDLLVAQNHYDLAKLTLATLLDRKPDFDVERPADVVEPAEDVANSENAFKQRLDLRAATLGHELARSVSRTGFLKYFPDIGFFANYKASNVQGFAGTYDNYSFGVSLSWNIFDGGLREAVLVENRAKRKEAYAQYRLTSNNVNKEVESAKLELQTAKANKKKAEDQLMLAQEAARLADVNYKAEIATYLDIVDANNTLSLAQTAAVNQGLLVNLSTLKLNRALGIF